MGRQRKSAAEHLANGTYRRALHGNLPDGLLVPKGYYRDYYQKKVAPILAAGFDCPQCTRRFFPTRRKKYCSPECRCDAGRVTVRCANAGFGNPECRRDFRAIPASHQRCCSQKCHNDYRERTAEPVDAECRLCGTLFVRLRHRTQHKYCSEKCQEAWRNRARSAYLRAYQRLREQRIRNTTIEKVSPLRVFERDGWLCYLCGGATSRAADPYSDPLYPTMDHVVPLSKGGPHTFENLRCAHRGCNTSKNNRDLSEMTCAACPQAA